MNQKNILTDLTHVPDLLRGHEKLLNKLFTAIERNELDIAIFSAQDLFVFLNPKDYREYLTFLMKEVICKSSKHPDLILTLVNYFPDALVKLSQKMAIGHFLELRDTQNLTNDVLLFQLQWLLISRDADRARQVVDELVSRFPLHLDLEDKIVKSVIAGLYHNISFILDFLPHIPEALTQRIRLSIVADFIGGFTLERAKQFRAEIAQLMRYSMPMFNDCLISLVYVKNDEVFFYLVELSEEHLRFDTKRIVYMLEHTAHLSMFQESLLDVIARNGTHKMKLWAKTQHAN